VTSQSSFARTLEDGRLEVVVQLRNREGRRIEVQANCVFKDVNGISTDDDTPFQTVILTENATEQVKFTSSNDKAKRYTVRVRQAR
jgi:predicted transcriptional regulator